MPQKKLKIVSVSSEVHPFSKTGGLADVARSLPKALKRLGHDVIVITPFYGSIIDPKKYDLKCIMRDIEIKIDAKHSIRVNYWKGYLMRGLPIYFVENEKYFSRYKKLYGSDHENARFMLFDIAALKLLILLRFKADIIQCHDWHTGLIPYFLNKDFKKSSVLKNAASVFTMHNLVFQFGHNWWEIKNGEKDDGYSKLPSFHTDELENINFAKRAILNADIINTVSENYAQEIMTKKFGEELQTIIKNRKDRVYGIVNGIDYFEYNPSTDPGLYRNYSSERINAREKNKTHIQKYFKLPLKKDIPLIGMTSRIAEQKGFDLLMDIMDVLMRMDLQMVVMGDGDKKYINFIKKIQKKYPKKLAYQTFNRKKETSIYAGADMLLLPSRFEPCGINQLISLRYGCIPIVRHIGGLVDTVADFNPKTKKGTGFVFKSYDSRSLLVAITRAVETYKYRDIWKQLVINGMKQSSSWEIPAKRYVTLFKKAIKEHKK